MASLISRWRRQWVAAAMTAASLGTAEAQVPKLPEYQVKAAYVFGFGRFVEWPADTPADNGGSFVVCVLGDDPFGRVLTEATAGGLIKDRPVSVRRIARPEDSESCHTLFVSASEEPRFARVFEVVGHRPVLTIGDTPDFAQRGGIVGFFVDGNRIRFTVNQRAALSAGLMLQSELLRVAAAVLRGR